MQEKFDKFKCRLDVVLDGFPKEGYRLLKEHILELVVGILIGGMVEM